MVKTKVVVKLSLNGAKMRSKALKTVALKEGVRSIALDGDRLVVVGDGIDPVEIVTALRKLGFAELVSVTSDYNNKDKYKESEPVDKGKSVQPTTPDSLLTTVKDDPYPYQEADKEVNPQNKESTDLFESRVEGASSEESCVSIVLRKIGGCIVPEALKERHSKLRSFAPVLREVEDHIKQIKIKFMVMQTFIELAGQTTNNRAFKSWLEQVRNVAKDVEEVINEYAHLIREIVEDSSLNNSDIVESWLYITSQLNRNESLLENLLAWKNNIPMSEEGEKSKLHCGVSLIEEGASGQSHYSSGNEDEIVGRDKERRILVKWLTNKNPDRVIVSIYGMGGLGKTFLTRSIYQDNQIRSMFDCCVWIPISQSYQVEDLFRSTIKQLLDMEQNNQDCVNSMDWGQLIEKLRTYLQDRRYFIVLDDIWDRDALSLLLDVFPKNSTASRVVITTRRKDVALLADNVLLGLRLSQRMMRLFSLERHSQRWKRLVNYLKVSCIWPKILSRSAKVCH